MALLCGRRVPVVWGTAWEDARGTPFGVWVDVLRRAIDAECRTLFRQLNALAVDKPHRADDPHERARKRICLAIGKLQALHPRLARHLERYVHTGTFCLCWPVEPIDWEL